MFGLGSLASWLFRSTAAVAVAIGVFHVYSIAPNSPPGTTFERDEAFEDARTDWRTGVSGLENSTSAWQDQRAKMEADMRVLEDYLTEGGTYP
jgi:hypothetical protein